MVVDVTDPANPRDRRPRARARPARTPSPACSRPTAPTPTPPVTTAPAASRSSTCATSTTPSRSTPTRRRRACRASRARPPGTSGTSTTPASAPTPGSTAPRCGARRNPRAPRLVTTTGARRQGDDPKYPGWNDFILHNSQRPNAKAFRNGAAPSLANGNILLVTEEDYEQPDCSQAGSFQTWWVKRLDGTPNAIVPLDKVELSDLGTFPLPVGAFCSSHWFDFHPSGHRRGRASTVAAPSSSTYATRKDLKSYGHATWGASEVWDSYWMPVYSKAGVMTSKKTNLAYSVDLARGIDVYRVDLPGHDLGHQRGRRIAPIGSGWTLDRRRSSACWAPWSWRSLLRRRTASRGVVALA